MPERKADAIVMIAEMSYWFHVYSVDSMTKRLQGCAALCREAGYRRGEAMSLAWLGVLLWLPGNRDRMERAAALWEESVGIARETEEPWVIALCLYFASIGRPRNDVDAETLRRRMEEAIALSRKAGDLFGMGFAIHGMGDLEHYQGNHAAAIPWFLESLGIAREADDRMLIMRTLVEMAVAEERCGGYTPATEHLREALLLALKDGAKSWAVVCVEQFGKVAKATGNLRRAARLISAARRLMAALPDAAGAPSDDARTVLEELFGSDGAGLVPDWSQGQAMTEDQAAAYALSGADGEPVAVR
jgi:tetratricopeptide (TPR) repeat protein